MWGLPRSGIESMSPALAGGFFTTEPPGKPFIFQLNSRVFPYPSKCAATNVTPFTGGHQPWAEVLPLPWPRLHTSLRWDVRETSRPWASYISETEARGKGLIPSSPPTHHMPALDLNSFGADIDMPLEAYTAFLIHGNCSQILLFQSNSATYPTGTRDFTSCFISVSLT